MKSRLAVVRYELIEELPEEFKVRFTEYSTKEWLNHVQGTIWNGAWPKAAFWEGDIPLAAGGLFRPSLLGRNYAFVLLCKSSPFTWRRLRPLIQAALPANDIHAVCEDDPALHRFIDFMGFEQAADGTYRWETS